MHCAWFREVARSIELDGEYRVIASKDFDRIQRRDDLIRHNVRVLRRNRKIRPAPSRAGAQTLQGYPTMSGTARPRPIYLLASFGVNSPLARPSLTAGWGCGLSEPCLTGSRCSEVVQCSAAFPSEPGVRALPILFDWRRAGSILQIPMRAAPGKDLRQAPGKHGHPFPPDGFPAPRTSSG